MLNAPLLNSAVDAFRIPDLRRKLVFTMMMLVAFRFIAHIPVPGADVEALSRVFQTNQLAGFFDLFSGGALSSLSIAALGVYPYITAQIIMQIMQPAIPKLQEVAKEGESGRQKINQWTHYLTVPLAMFQAYGTPNLINFSSGGNTPIIKDFGFDVNPLGTLAIIISMTAGTMLLVWMGELITQYGVGQGVSIIIFGGIMARLPFQVFQGLAGGADFGQLILFGLLALVTVVAIIYIYEGQRRIPVQISKQIRGNRVYGGGTTHIPLKVNSAGMIPLIFASSMLILPWTISSYFVNSDIQIVSTIATAVYNTFNAGTSPFYWFLYFVMVVAFTFFYALVIFQQQNIAENLQRQNGFIPGIRPGRPTHQYLLQVLIRITVAGALFLGIIAVLPFIVKSATGFQTLAISSTAVLIVVGVALDTMRQLEAQLIMRNYRGFIGR
ncbi:MAG TPA: preprotein translocase subunit SecY [Chloroflexota bacterium]|jgi:preprotein translocase subunit SecY